MKTVIFKWNPSFSSYSMSHFLIDIINRNDCVPGDYNWSVWDYDHIHKGDRYYWVKLGHGATGIVGRGVITSEPYEDEDWTGKGRQTFYVDFYPEILLNPDALPILTIETLKSRIPGFEWDHGHSGLVLNEEQASALDGLWDEFVNAHRSDFEKKSNADREENDYIYWDQHDY